MKLFLVSRTDEIDWDEFESFVIACETEDEAKNADPANGKEFKWDGDYFETEHWCVYAHLVKVQYLGEANSNVAKGIVCSSFNAG